MIALVWWWILRARALFEVRGKENLRTTKSNKSHGSSSSTRGRLFFVTRGEIFTITHFLLGIKGVANEIFFDIYKKNFTSLGKLILFPQTFNIWVCVQKIISFIYHHQFMIYNNFIHIFIALCASSKANFQGLWALG